MKAMKYIILTSACALALAACTTTGQAMKKQSAADGMEITGAATTSMTTKPMVASDPSVQVFALDGGAQNPLAQQTGHGVLDNTTSGGYTVFDQSVTVYPLPGDSSPDYMPQYTVPPLLGQQATTDKNSPASGKASEAVVGMASAGSLPPVPNVDVPVANPYANPPISGAVRQPLTLTAPDASAMQPPASAQKPYPVTSSLPALTPPPAGSMTREPTPPPSVDSTGTTSATTSLPTTAAGRRSSPLLTGY